MNDNRRSLMLGCPLSTCDTGYVHPGRIYAFGPYIPVSRAEHWGSSWSQMVLQAKRHDAWIILNVGRILAAHLAYWLNPGDAYVMTHVPTDSVGKHSHVVRDRACTAKRLTEAICEELHEPLHVNRGDLLVMARRKAKKQRRCASIAEREQNVRGCYQVRRVGCVHGKNVILVDDIVTTGATMRECARALLRAGALGVTGVAMARTVRMDRLPARQQVGYELYPSA